MDVAVHVNHTNVNDTSDEDDDESEGNDDDDNDDINDNEEDDLVNRTFINPSQSDDSDNGANSAKIIQCELCRFKTSIPTDLTVHQEKTHNWCLIFDKVFPSKKLYKSHNHKMHNKK